MSRNESGFELRVRRYKREESPRGCRTPQTSEANARRPSLSWDQAPSATRGYPLAGQLQATEQQLEIFRGRENHKVMRSATPHNRNLDWPTASGKGRALLNKPA